MVSDGGILHAVFACTVLLYSTVLACVVVTAIKLFGKKLAVLFQFHTLASGCLFARIIHYSVFFLQVAEKKCGFNERYEFATFWFVEACVSLGIFICFMIVGLYWPEILRLGSFSSPQTSRVRTFVQKRNKFLLSFALISVVIFAGVLYASAATGCFQRASVLLNFTFFVGLSIVSSVYLSSHGLKWVRLFKGSCGKSMLISDEMASFMRRILYTVAGCVVSFILRGCFLTWYNLYLVKSLEAKEKFILISAHYVLLEVIPMMAVVVLLRTVVRRCVSQYIPPESCEDILADKQINGNM